MRVACDLWTGIVGRPLGALSGRPTIQAVWAVIGASITIVALLGLAMATIMCLVGPAVWTRSLVAGTSLERLAPASLSVVAMLVLLAFGRHTLRSMNGRDPLDIDFVFVSLGAAVSAFFLLWAAAVGWPVP